MAKFRIEWCTSSNFATVVEGQSRDEVRARWAREDEDTR